VRLADAGLCLGLGQGLHVGDARDMGREHDVCGAVGAQHEDALQDVHDKVHRRHVVVVDEDAIERLEFGFLVGNDLDVWEAGGGHVPVIVHKKNRLLALFLPQNQKPILGEGREGVE